MLAVLIRSPSRYDPEVSPEDAQDRWGRVLDAMVEEGWMTAEERAASVYPPVEPKAASSLGIPTGPEGLIVNRVLIEMENRARLRRAADPRRWPPDHHDGGSAPCRTPR